MKFTIENLNLTANELPASVDQELIPHIAAYAGVKQEDVLSYRITRRSIDARMKPELKLIYSIEAEVREGVRPYREIEMAPAEAEHEPVAFHCVNPPQNVLVIGAGPAGLFSALILAMAGCHPVVLERGRDVTRRKEDIDQFLATRKLNTESNLLFGEGGAGTWSDGKLFTRAHDPRISFVLDEFIAAGAPAEIGYFSHPHVGSDKLPEVVANLRKKIIELGGTFRFDSCVEDLIVQDGVCRGVILSGGEKLEAPSVIAACGHSARKFIKAMIHAGAACSLKGFQVGCRIEHPQNFINFVQFGLKEAPAALGNAEYNFISHAGNGCGGATSFCMCPGGELLPATSDEGQLSTNGMSNHARDGKFANAAIVTTIPPEKFSSPEEAFNYLDSLERKVFETGGSNYSCPAQNALDFMCRNSAGKLHWKTSYSLGLRDTDMNKLLPRNVCESIRRALAHFDHIAPGFIRYGTLVGMETRVSSPVRFERTEAYESSTISGLYLAGEGAGMAGGITTSAVDGIRAAEAILKKGSL